MKQKLDLAAFTRRVNEVSASWASSLNANNPLFGTVHRDYPQEVVQMYYDQGLTPEEAQAAIRNERY